MGGKRQVKVGAQLGGGLPPGYAWSAWFLDIAGDEGLKLLGRDRYDHMVMQVKALAREHDPTHPATASVDAIEDFYELRDKGGILGKLNVRLFFHLDKEKSAIVVLGVIHKQNDGQTPVGDRKRMARRKRKYINGDYGGP